MKEEIGDGDIIDTSECSQETVQVGCSQPDSDVANSHWPKDGCEDNEERIQCVPENSALEADNENTNENENAAGTVQISDVGFQENGIFTPLDQVHYYNIASESVEEVEVNADGLNCCTTGQPHSVASGSNPNVLDYSYEIQKEIPEAGETQDLGSLFYEPPRFPRVEVPFVSCDLLPGDLQQSFSPLGIRQLMMSSSITYPWDSTPSDDSPAAVLKNAAKSFLCTPSIMKKRQRDLLSPLQKSGGREFSTMRINSTNEFGRKSSSSVIKIEGTCLASYFDDEAPEAKPQAQNIDESREQIVHPSRSERVGGFIYVL